MKEIEHFLRVRVEKQEAVRMRCLLAMILWQLLMV